MYPLLQALRAMPGVKRCYTFGATLHLVADEGFDAGKTVAALTASGLGDVRLFPVKGDIEDLFIKLAGDE